MTATRLPDGACAARARRRTGHVICVGHPMAYAPRYVAHLAFGLAVATVTQAAGSWCLRGRRP